jgi:hypothetical protein
MYVQGLSILGCTFEQLCLWREYKYDTKCIVLADNFFLQGSFFLHIALKTVMKYDSGLHIAYFHQLLYLTAALYVCGGTSRLKCISPPVP